MRVCTIVAANYLPYARVLASSFCAANPDGHVDVLVVDADQLEPTTNEQFEVLTPAEIGLSRQEFRAMAAIYDVTELSTALKPWLLEELLRRSDEPVIYLDPDIRVFASLGVVIDELAHAGLLFTPHTTRPMPRDGGRPDERDILLSGTYNLGFVAVDRRAVPFLTWWQERLARDCLHDAPNGLFVDQRWVDLAVHYFDCRSLRDEGCNVAYWNVDQRPLRWDGEQYLAADRPLRFFHFSGYRPELPHILSKHHLSSARQDAGSSELLTRLCHEYSADLREAGYDAGTMKQYGYAKTADGLALTTPIRRRYRAALIDHGLEAVPDPFDPAQDGEFRRWLKSRTLLRQRVVARLPESGRQVVKAFQQPALARDVLRARLAARRSVAPPAARLPSAGELQGVNVVGYFHAEDGVGQGARSLVACLAAAGIEHTLTANPRTPTRQGHDFDVGPPARAYDVDIICANADAFADTMRMVHAQHGRARYTIGVWAWEVEHFPEGMRVAADLTDEIWTLSRHSAAAIAPVVDKPVLVFPYPVLPPERVPELTTALPVGFRFLFCCDLRSGFARKNPDAVVRAFCQAFEENSGPHLVLKVINGDIDRQAMEHLDRLIGARGDIVLLTETMPPDQQAALMASCDCYVSLHRAEGLGFTMAEAMVRGKPVVATAYSGNLEFMNVGNSYLVPYDPVRIPPGCDPYSAGGIWAEPDVAAAASALREIVADPAAAARRGARGRADVRRDHSPAARMEFLQNRIRVIAELLAGTGS